MIVNQLASAYDRKKQNDYWVEKLWATCCKDFVALKTQIYIITLCWALVRREPSSSTTLDCVSENTERVTHFFQFSFSSLVCF